MGGRRARRSYGLPEAWKSHLSMNFRKVRHGHRSSIRLMPKIILHHPDGTSVKYGLNGSVFTIGRAENNDIVLKDGSSSSSHAVLKLTDCGDFSVTDLESTNF